MVSMFACKEFWLCFRYRSARSFALELEKTQLSEFENKNYLLIYLVENQTGGSTPVLWAIGRGTPKRGASFAHVVCETCTKISILHDRKRRLLVLRVAISF